MKWALSRLSAALAFVLDWGLPLTPQPSPTKSIAIIGGGSAGLGALQVILEIQHQKNLNWEVVLYEQRRGLGGVW
jgi:cation diffusion facilitator CzcD-associated flavoprotein CzcO